MNKLVLELERLQEKATQVNGYIREVKSMIKDSRFLCEKHSPIDINHIPVFYISKENWDWDEDCEPSGQYKYYAFLLYYRKVLKEIEKQIKLKKRLIKVEQKKQGNRKLKQLLLMGVPIQYHQYHNWHPVKNFGHFLMLEKDSCTDFRVDTAFKKSQIYYSNKTKAPTTSPKKGDTFVGSYETYIKWVKEHLEWEPTFMEDKTYYIRPVLGCGGCGYSFEECQNKLLNVKLGQGENIVMV